MNKEEILGILDALKESCKEGIDGIWDCNTDEGKKSFIPMIEDLDLVIEFIKLQVK